MTRKVAIVADFIEEAWPSMDLVAEMLQAHLGEVDSARVRPTLLRPAMRRRFGRPLGSSGHNADRLVNRFWDYPRFLRRQRGEFDLFHLVDHSYAQLVHELPASRTVVTCHDLDTFGCVLGAGGGSRLYRAFARRTLEGLALAQRVICVSEQTRDEILAHGLVRPERLVVIPNGIHPSCTPGADLLADREAERLLGAASADAPEILHVGSTIPRKRVDRLLEVFAGIQAEWPAARLVRVGGPLTPEQARLADRVGIADSLRELPFVGREVLAAVYRRAALLLQTSEREGFGLPVLEALACGTPVLATDLPVFREIAGNAVEYRGLDDQSGWTESALRLLRERRDLPEQWATRVERGIAQAARFSWSENARRTMQIYQEMWTA